MRDLPRRVLPGLRARKSALASRYFLSLGSADPEMVFIAGTGRSGTTWLAEIILRASKRRLIFEPFRNDRVPLWGRAARRQYLRPDADGGELHSAARAFLRGDVRNEWIDYYNNRFLTRGLLVKDIRANLLLAWLNDKFGPFPLVYLVRHPGAVATSWLREGWPADLDEFLNQPELVSDYLAPFESDLRTARERFDRCVYFWCVENFVALEQLSTNKHALVVFYENMILDPDIEIRRIFRHFDIEESQARALAKQTRLAAPSMTTTPGVHYESQLERLTRWRDALSDAERARLTAILDVFDLARVYGSDDLPSIAPGESVNPRAIV